MSEWTDEDDAECEAACKKWTYIDGRIGVLNDRLNYIMAKPAEYSLAEERELRAEIIRLKGELNALKNSGREVQPQRDFTEAQQRQVERIEKVRELMQQEIDSTAWPTTRQGKEGLLGFVWRKHTPAIKRIYGEVEYDTIRRKTTPQECKRLGLEPLPK